MSDKPLTYLPVTGLPPAQQKVLQEALNLVTYEDIITWFPFRYEDRTRYYAISELKPGLPLRQCKGTIENLRLSQAKGKKGVLSAELTDGRGRLWLVWFHQLDFIHKKLKPGKEYVLFGKVVWYQRQRAMIHPEFRLWTPEQQKQETHLLQPVYASTKQLALAKLDTKGISRLQHYLLHKVLQGKIVDNLPAYIQKEYNLLSRAAALHAVHFPSTTTQLAQGRRRLKFEELLYLQLRLLASTEKPFDKVAGMVFTNTSLVAELERHLPFVLTAAQRKCVQEITHDLASGKQMNRLLQGDVGSGKTLVAFMAMLIPCADGAQAALMAPTELLAAQHYNTLLPYATALSVRLALLTSATPYGVRQELYDKLLQGTVDILIGTHALLQDKVAFHRLGLVVIDEQHRFGVEQRAKLWDKGSETCAPHILLTTATPIPRTLAMTLYSNLDSSLLDELPPGRKPVKTFHRFDAHRLALFGFIRKQINAGRQVYIVYPVIHETEKSDYKNLIAGYESICRAFPEYPVSILHGQMKPADKAYEIDRFIKQETKILVSTSIIEVGVDIPNASVMVVESAERFALTQLHQLRGRVGRGSEQSYCVLMTTNVLNEGARERIRCMVQTNDGFAIANTDLRLRGPGNLAGVEQSGLFALKIANLQDSDLVQEARQAVRKILTADPGLTEARHACIRTHLAYLEERAPNLSKVS